MTNVSLPEADSTTTLASSDLVPVFRATEKDASASNYGLYSQAMGDLKPEYRTQEITLNIVSGALTTSEADRTLSAANSRFATPTLAWVVVQAEWTSTGTTTRWFARGQWRNRTDANLNSITRSWYYAKQFASQTGERIGNTSNSNRATWYLLGTNRVPSGAAGGWDLQVQPSTRILRLNEDGTAPRSAYQCVVQVGYALI